MQLACTRTRKKEIRRKGIRTERIELLPKVEAINAPKVHITYPKGTYHGHEVSISREQKRIYYPWALRMPLLTYHSEQREDS